MIPKQKFTTICKPIRPKHGIDPNYAPTKIPTVHSLMLPHVTSHFTFSIIGIPHTFLATHFCGETQLSSCFSYEALVHCPPQFNLLEHIGSHARISLNKHTHFNGLLSSALPVLDDTSSDSQLCFRVCLIPALAQLANKKHTRIFHQRSVVNIVQTLLTENNIHPVRYILTDHYPRIPFLKQFNETDFALIQRLLSLWGIFYLFTPDNTLILADHNAYTNTRTNLYAQAVWHHQKLCSTQCVVSGFDQENATHTPHASSTTTPHYFLSTQHSFLNVSAKNTLQRFSNNLLQALKCQYIYTEGQSKNRCIHAGSIVTLYSENQQDIGEYLITKVTHNAYNDNVISQSHRQAPSYFNTFQVCKMSQEFKASRKITAPKMQQAYPSTVTKTANAKGKVVCHFSTPHAIPCTQILASKTAATQYLPAIKQTVHLHYIQENPSNPIIIHAPRKNQNNKTSMSGMRSMSQHFLFKKINNDSHITINTPGHFNQYAANIYYDIGGNYTLSASNAHVSLSIKGSCIISARQKIHFQVGDNYMTITPDSIIFNTCMLHLDSR